MNANGVDPHACRMREFSFVVICSCTYASKTCSTLIGKDVRRAEAHGLAARFVYVFRGVSESERRGRKDTGQAAASTECGARKLNFEMCALHAGKVAL